MGWSAVLFLTYLSRGVAEHAEVTNERPLHFSAAPRETLCLAAAGNDRDCVAG
jgi:hypothetical protein